ncbi:MAG: hypothetical protein ACRDRJ_18565 [Streptosporangiaceae bacterium]
MTPGAATTRTTSSSTAAGSASKYGAGHVDILPGPGAAVAGS